MDGFDDNHYNKIMLNIGAFLIENNDTIHSNEIVYLNNFYLNMYMRILHNIMKILFYK
jgi:hypothetical protein